QECADRNTHILDPFCGTGRILLAAAERGAHAFGVDINPLAAMIVRAKASAHRVSSRRLRILSRRLRPGVALEYQPVVPPQARVHWFSPSVALELEAILCTLNALECSESELLLLSAILSATVREAAVTRQDQWKLHRLSVRARRIRRVSPFEILARR